MKNRKAMQKTIFLAFLALAAISPATAQYYYKDIISNRQLLDEMQRLKEQKVRKIVIKSFEDDGSPSDGFFCEKNLNRSYTSVETVTKSNVTGSSVFISTFDKNGLLLTSVDSSDIASNNSSYQYDEGGRIKSIRSSVRSNDDDFSNEIVEEHHYRYDEKGQLLSMVFVKNGTDSSIILFSLDERNNIGIEKNTKTGATYYYYYDDRKRLTDVVHLNPFNQMMLPDYMFEYNAAGLISQMTSTEEGGSYYFIWKYTYDNGLRSGEKCFSKEKRLMGRIEYEYK
jgi:hypothetical protein